MKKTWIVTIFASIGMTLLILLINYVRPIFGTGMFIDSLFFMVLFLFYMSAIIIIKQVCKKANNFIERDYTQPQSSKKLILFKMFMIVGLLAYVISYNTSFIGNWLSLIAIILTANYFNLLCMQSPLKINLEYKVMVSLVYVATVSTVLMLIFI